MNLINAIKEVLTNPDQYSRKIKGISRNNSLKFLIKSFSLFAIFSLLLNSRKIYSGSVEAGKNVFGVWVTAFIFYIVSAVILVFLGAVILHLFAKIMKSKEKFSDTFAIYAYGALPFALIGWIPYAKILGLVYTFYVQIIALEYSHYMKKSVAIAAYVFHFVTLLICLGIIRMLLGV